MLNLNGIRLFVVMHRPNGEFDKLVAVPEHTQLKEVKQIWCDKHNAEYGLSSEEEWSGPSHFDEEYYIIEIDRTKVYDKAFHTTPKRYMKIHLDSMEPEDSRLKVWLENNGVTMKIVGENPMGYECLFVGYDYKIFQLVQNFWDDVSLFEYAEEIT